MKRKAVVLLSGGLDSATILYYAAKKGFDAYGLVFDYGQRHARELKSAVQVAHFAGIPFEKIKISLPWKGSSLLDKKMALPKSERFRKNDVPSTYVPARNTIFLSFALSFAESLGCRHIFIGANAVDYSGYPDCRPAYFKALNKMAPLATQCGVNGKGIKIHAPLLRLKKSGIIKLGLTLGVPYHLTWSCYQGAAYPCGNCDSCVLRAKGFKEAGLEDPALRR